MLRLFEFSNYLDQPKAKTIKYFLIQTLWQKGAYPFGLLIASLKDNCVLFILLWILFYIFSD